MPRATVSEAVERAVSPRRLLDHPYYRSWQDGQLTREDLRTYAEQYRHFEAVLPEALAAAAAMMADEAARSMTEQNLRDELSSPAPHLDLFADFAGAFGASPGATSSPATTRLTGLYERAAAEGPIPALSVIAAYEVQAADVAATKSSALRRHYALAAGETAFWDVHADMEREHASWTVDALGALGADPEVVETWADRSSHAWWSFLDEREASRAATASA